MLFVFCAVIVHFHFIEFVSLQQTAIVLYFFRYVTNKSIE
jgi:hypothetical protein